MMTQRYQFCGIGKKDEFRAAVPAYNPYYGGSVFQPVKPPAQYNVENYLKQFENQNLENETLNILLQQALVEINTREKIIKELQIQGGQQFNNNLEELSYSSQSPLNEMSQGSFRDGASSNSSLETALSLQMSNLNPFASSFLNFQKYKSEEIYSDAATLENKLGQDLVRCLSK